MMALQLMKNPLEVQWGIRSIFIRLLHAIQQFTQQSDGYVVADHAGGPQNIVGIRRKFVDAGRDKFRYALADPTLLYP